MEIRAAARSSAALSRTGTLHGLWRYAGVPGSRAAMISAGPTNGRSDKVAYDRIPPLTAEEMSALASRFEARAASILLRDQPQMQSDMRLAARLINEWTGRVGGVADEPHPGTGRAR
jgi:hypothetical protein